MEKAQLQLVAEEESLGMQWGVDTLSAASWLLPALPQSASSAAQPPASSAPFPPSFWSRAGSSTWGSLDSGDTDQRREV